MEGFNLFQKLGRLNMMQICEALEMENFNKVNLISFKNKDEESIFFLKRDCKN